MPEPSVPPSFKPVDIGPIGEAIAAQVAAFHEARLRQFGQQDAYFSRPSPWLRPRTPFATSQATPRRARWCGRSASFSTR